MIALVKKDLILDSSGLQITRDVSANKFIGSSSQITGDVTANNFIGSGSQISNLNPKNIDGVVPMEKGGTGVSSFINNQLFIGTNNGIKQSPNLTWENYKLQVTSDVP